MSNEKFGWKPTEKDRLKPKHLKPGFKPVMSCIGNISEHYYDGKKSILYNINTDNISYFLDEKEMENKGILNNRKYSYVISSIDSKNKYTSTLRNCTGCVIVGVDKKTGKNISILTHQNPREVLSNDKDGNKFYLDFKKRLDELQNESIVGSIDAVIFGGNYIGEKVLSGMDYNKDYLESVQKISSIIKNEFNFEPVVMSGPKIEFGEDEVIFINEERKLYIVRDSEVRNQNINKPYKVSNIDNIKYEWENKEN